MNIQILRLGWRFFCPVIRRFHFSVSCIDFASFYDFDIWFWNCSDNVVWFCFEIWFWNCSDNVVCICFDIWFWNCSDNVVWFCFDIRFWNCSDNVVWFVLIFDSGIVLTVWYLILELFRQSVWFCFYIWFWNCSGSVVWICFDIWFWNCSDNVFFFFFSFYILVSHVFVIMFLTSMTVTRENRKTFTTRLLFSCFHKLLKTFPTFYYRYGNLYIDAIPNADIWSKKGIYHPCFMAT